MKLFVFSDLSSAQQANANAFALLKSSEGAIGNGWSDIWTDGSRFGILLDSSFTVENAEVVDLTEEWSVYPPRASEES